MASFSPSCLAAMLNAARTDEAIQIVEDHLHASHERLYAVHQPANAGHAETAIRLAEAAIR